MATIKRIFESLAWNRYVGAEINIAKIGAFANILLELTYAALIFIFCNVNSIEILVPSVMY